MTYSEIPQVELLQVSDMRFALGVQYDGSAFCGWQIQDNVRTVQQVLEQAVSKVVDEKIRLKCAGRTDTGVHGIAQVVHFDTSAIRDEKALIFGSNTFMDGDVSVVWAKSVSEDFDARFSAQSRRYRYIICNSAIRPALLRKHVCWNYRPLDVDKMAAAATYLLGNHDFSSYRAAGCQAKSAVRDLQELEVSRSGDAVFIDIKANAFLQHMVRNIAGVLMKIGAGEREPVWAKEVLEYRDRTKAGVTASPYGLYFVGAYYPESFNLPQPVLSKHLIPSIQAGQ